jgi:opacity protein-like surface antigen
LEVLLRKLAFLVPAFALLFLAQFASAQQGDVFLGGGSLFSSGTCNSTTGLCPEKGGLYINLGGDVVLHKHIGVNVETAWRATQSTYPNLGENYRPILTDFNLLYQPHLSKKVGLDLMAGIGSGDTRFYTPGPTCPGCANYGSTDHFMEHLGGGIRYYVWNHVFVRPEIHYYHIQNNNNLDNNGYFSTNNVFRASASIGYTFGGD